MGFEYMPEMGRATGTGGGGEVLESENIFGDYKARRKFPTYGSHYISYTVGVFSLGAASSTIRVDTLSISQQGLSMRTGSAVSSCKSSLEFWLQILHLRKKVQ
jgi:hypothetical protein